MRSLNTGHTRLTIAGIVLITVLLAAWVIWLVAANVVVYAVSQNARVEADRAAHPIQSLYSGRVAINNLVLGQQVKRGDVLLELEVNVQQLELLEQETGDSTLEDQISSIKNKIAAEQRAQAEERRAAQIGIEEASAKAIEAEAGVASAELESDRASKLYSAGLLAQNELSRAVTELKKHRAAADSLRLAVSRLRQELAARRSGRESQIESLRGELKSLSGQKLKLGKTVDRLRSEIELRRIVAAPIDGTIGQVANLRAGTVLQAGEQLGAIIPQGQLKITAQFEPAVALGRIRVGQTARLRLDGFPWTQFGSVNATVLNVANEVRDGRVRVDLGLTTVSPMPLQHGLPGIVEVEIEKVSPAFLILRLAGRTLSVQGS